MRKSDLKNSGFNKKLDEIITKDLPEPGTQRVYPQRLLAEAFTLAEIRAIGKWIKASDYEAFLNGLLSLRYGDFTPKNIDLIVQAIDEGIGEDILDSAVGIKLTSLLAGSL